MPRPLRYALLAAAALGFLVASLLLARMLAAAGAEREAAVDIVVAQSRGDGDRLIAGIEGCASDPACRARAEGNARRLRTREEVKVVRLDGPTRLAAGSRNGTMRIVWTEGERLPVVQCVRLRRDGDLVRGFRIRVLGLSAPIPREGSCPGA